MQQSPQDGVSAPGLLWQLLRSPSLLVLVCFLVRIAYLIQSQRVEVAMGLPFVSHPVGYEVGNIARSIVLGHGYSSPLDVDTGPSAWITPAFPYILAGLFKVFGIFSPAARLVGFALNCFFSALVVLPLFALTKSVSNRNIAATAAWGWIFLPAANYFSTQGLWDASLCALMMTTLLWATIEIQFSRQLRHWVGYGALWALALMVNAATLSLLPFHFAWLAWRLRRSGPSAMRSVAFALLFIGLGVSPWLVRNQIVFGKFIPLRSNFGLELYLGNNEQVPQTWAWWLHPYGNTEERQRFQKLGEIQYMAEKQLAALQFIRTHPRQFLRLTWNRFAQTWTALDDSLLEILPRANLRLRLEILFNCALSLLAFFGLYFLSKDGNFSALPLAIVVFLFPAVYYLTHTTARYRHPIDPLLVFLAAFALWTAANRVRTPARSRTRGPASSNTSLQPLS